MTPHFYEPLDGAYRPTGLARSPWDRNTQNGVALGGLATHLLEQVPAPAEMTTARLTIDILAAAPHAPVETRTRVVREGRRIQMVECDLLVADRPVARATALRVRDLETPQFGATAHYPDYRDLEPTRFMDETAFGGCLETRVVHGGLREPGPGAVWVRFGHEHVQGVPLSPLVRAAMLGDFGGGLGSVLDRRNWTYANLDISLHLLREPVGEWLLVDASTASEGRGVGRSDMILADDVGPFARAHQTLFVAPATPPSR